MERSGEEREVVGELMVGGWKGTLSFFFLMVLKHGAAGDLYSTTAVGSLLCHAWPHVDVSCLIRSRIFLPVKRLQSAFAFYSCTVRVTSRLVTTLLRNTAFTFQ